MNFLGIGGLELMIIALVAFLVLGPRKMAEAGKTIAKVLTELRKQRDELTQALLIEPEPEPRKPAALPGETRSPQDQPVEHSSNDDPGNRPSPADKSPDRPGS